METHEPIEPTNWPDGHVNTSYVKDPDVEECILVTIHGVDHYLHATTARALHQSLGFTLNDWNKYARELLKKLGIRHKPV